ncbi:MAG: hypothetical protein WD044_07415 [Dongiaceae bacterium]
MLQKAWDAVATSLGRRKRHAVVTMANDDFLEWFVGFLESFRRYNPTLPLWVVPFDDNFETVERLSRVYRYKLFRSGPVAEIETVRSTLYDDRYWKNRIRKLHCFAIPVPEFLYIDADSIVAHDLSPLFGLLRDDRPFLYGVTQVVGVYTAAAMAARPDTVLFSTGIYASSNKYISLQRIVDFALANAAAIREISPPSDIDQPLTNYFIEQQRIPIGPLDGLQSVIQAVEWAGKWDQLEIGADWIRHNLTGKRVGIVHFSGRSRELSKGSPLDAMRREFLAAGFARMRRAGIAVPFRTG